MIVLFAFDRTFKVNLIKQILFLYDSNVMQKLILINVLIVMIDFDYQLTTSGRTDTL